MSMAPENGDVLIRVTGRAGRITLNRPKALNALTWDMALAIEAALDDWAGDDRVAVVIIDAVGEKAFCAGGDIQRLYTEGRAGNFAYGRNFWADEYRLNARIARYPKPYVALMDGIVMGGGVGVSVHGSHRIVTERSTVAMPECSIGLVTDVGASLVLANAPGHLGEYLALTGFRMNATDAIVAGFADACVASQDLPNLVAELAETGDAKAIRRFVLLPPTGKLEHRMDDIARLFSGATLPDIVDALAADDGEFAAESLKALQKASPLSAAAILDIIRTVRAERTIETALREEYRFTFRSQSEGEFLEGIRAAVIDKDRAPNWSPGWNASLDEAAVARMRAPLGEDELKF